jgi:NAD(P)-dependent dehydrogenase (short-subunit alcohol dehydrogenase family)
VKTLTSKGITSAAFPANAGDPASIRAAIGKARGLGAITVLHWNASDGAAGDFLTEDPLKIRTVFDTSVVGLVAAVQEVLPDLKKAEGSNGVLITNGAFGDIDPVMDKLAIPGSMGLALANGAKHKLVGLLAERLKAEGVYVGEVVVAGAVKGTRWDRGQANLDASVIAAKFWELHQARKDVRARVS